MTGSSQQKATSTSTSEPWKEQIPYLEKGFESAEDLWKAPGPEFFPGSTVAGFSPEQQQAHMLGSQRALAGNATMDAAEGYGQDVLGGNYLNSDPYQDSVFQNIQSHVMPSVNSQFMQSGRYGSDLHGDTMTRAMTEAYAPYASQQYQQGLDRMDNAMSFAPQFAANDYQDIAALDTVGGAKQGLAQRETDDAVNRHAYYQDLPYNKLGQYMGLIGGNWGGTTTSSQPYYQPSPFSQIAGLGIGALGAAGSAGLFSDARLKQNIRPLTRMDNGVTIYAYEFKGSDVTQFGVIAQEVEKTHPEAVFTDPASGFKKVNYAALTA